MHYLFVDETGDLGFSKKSTRYFVVGCVYTPSAARLRKEMQRIREKLRGKGYAEDEIKFRLRKKARRVDDVAKYILKKVVENTKLKETKFGGIALDKITVNENLRSKPYILRNYILVHHVIWGLYSDANVKIHEGDKLVIIYDKSMGPKSIWEFNEYLRSKLNWTEGLLHKPPVHPEVKHVDSRADLGVQLADLVSGAIWQGYENGNWEYYEIIKERVMFLRPLFKK
ncbi:MAG: DUF3800 domain-containing protein [Candidatus Korarchaeota archaeon]|nr:DUF3800 domain-containing protein [Candidatus Korarchaeota archaeon]